MEESGASGACKSENSLLTRGCKVATSQAAESAMLADSELGLRHSNILAHRQTLKESFVSLVLNAMNGLLVTIVSD